MKLKKITICGMHKVSRQVYEFNDDVTYLVGPNGAGKSTVLEAIQLALLGYIPGYAKTNESIIKHASGPAMSIEAEFDTGAKITRTWVKSGSTAKSTMNLEGYSGSLDSLIGDMALPVFDFNEFKSMTANKLKDWFIRFLPSSTADFNLEKELEAAVSSKALPHDELLSQIVQWAVESGLTGLDLVRALNTKLKSDQSYLKGQIAQLTGTIQSLVRYDDADTLDSTLINSEIARLEQLKDSLVRYNASLESYNNAASVVAGLRANLPADSADSDERVVTVQNKISELEKKSSVLKADYQDLQNQISELQLQKARLPRAGSTCPYTNDPCETAAKLLDKVNEQIAEFDNQIKFKQEEMTECDLSVSAAIDREIFSLKTALSDIYAQYDRLAAMQIQLESIHLDEQPTTKPIAEIDSELNVLRQQLVQVAANKRYDELSAQVTADKFKLENDLEIYKIWVKKTDANGLQTDLMNKPFEDLAGDMSKYLTQIFNRPTVAKFNLVGKANSFSFGIDREGQYIEFDYLSSGERALFTLALILCILNRSTSQVKTILIDDILDHLDDDNATYLFNTLQSIPDVQFILAGVKSCPIQSICLPIG